jgi:hypothetical protein
MIFNARQSLAVFGIAATLVSMGVSIYVLISALLVITATGEPTPLFIQSFLIVVSVVLGGSAVAIQQILKLPRKT